MPKVCTILHFNWFAWEADEYILRRVGEDGVVSIKDPNPAGFPYQDVYFVDYEDGSREVIYNPNYAKFEEVEK